MDASAFRAAHIPIHTPTVAATHNGLLAPELAAAMGRVKRAYSIGVGSGTWLTHPAGPELLNALNIRPPCAARRRHHRAVLLGAALRRSAIAALTGGTLGRKQAES